MSLVTYPPPAVCEPDRPATDPTALPVPRPQGSRVRLLWLAFFSFQFLVVLVSAQLHASHTNTLAGSGNWVSSKTLLAKRVMGAVHYVTTPETLAGGRLDLGRWHGYQEVLYHEPLAPTEVAFDCLLSEDSYLTFVFNKTSEGFSGLRLSRNGQVESTYFTAREDGEFLFTERLAGVDLDGEWKRLRVSFENNGVSAWLEGQLLGSFQASIAPRHLVGFRGGLRSVLIDNVEIRQADSRQLIREFFYNSGGFSQALAAAGFAVAVADALLIAAVRRRKAPPRRLMFASLTVVLTLLACLLVYFVAYRSLLSKGYLNFASRSDADFKEQEIDAIRREIRERHTLLPAGDTIRVLVIGTSQTWGAGAAREEETFSRVLERSLNATASNGRRFECINAGVSALESARLLDLYIEDWVRLSPHIVVLNLSSNDGSAGTFEASLERLVRMNRERGVKTLFVLEANSVEHRPTLPMHGTMRKVARKGRVPIVDIHDYLRRAAPRGLIWWDFVHPTSFGHRLIAEGLRPEIEQLARDLP